MAMTFNFKLRLVNQLQLLIAGVEIVGSKRAMLEDSDEFQNALFCEEDDRKQYLV